MIALRCVSGLIRKDRSARPEPKSSWKLLESAYASCRPQTGVIADVEECEGGAGSVDRDALLPP